MGMVTRVLGRPSRGMIFDRAAGIGLRQRMDRALQDGAKSWTLQGSWRGP